MRRFLGAALAILGVASVLSGPLFAQNLANPAFERVWNRQDRAVAERVANRSWTWGPGPITNEMAEQYVDAPGQGSTRQVQYFDKSRMEINDPTADSTTLWFVTNGLLPIEMMTGRKQIGLNTFVELSPAPIAVAGDPGSFPTYADLTPIYQSPGAVDPNRIGKPVTDMVTPASLQPGAAFPAFNQYIDDPATILRQGENGHGVAQAFLDFQNQNGQVWEGGSYVNAQVYDPTFVFGLPVTEPYWVNVQVGGQETPVLFQVFERRVLTYNPTNEPAFRVEMGNVGQHFFCWQYTNTELGSDYCRDFNVPEEPTAEPTAEPTEEPTEEPYPAP